MQGVRWLERSTFRYGDVWAVFLVGDFNWVRLTPVEIEKR
jgi:hypothetical protein